MSEGKLKTAVLGLDDGGQVLLEAAYKSDYFEIQAVADRDTHLAERIASEYNCASYDDYRRLVIENQFDCLFVAAGMHSCAEYVRMAIKKKINILKLAPPARDFEEAAELVRLAKGKRVKFAIANPSRFAQSFLCFREFLQQEQIEQIFLISGVCSVGGQSHPGWQSDPKLGGGGVLLHDCYNILDQIIWNFSWPEQVYSLNTNTAGDRQQRQYLTEDTAVVTMKFSDSIIGNLIASKVFGPKQQFIKVYGKDKILIVNDKQLTISDSSGNIIEEHKYDDDKLGWYTALLEDFALSILEPAENKLYGSASEQLRNMAVVESAYLSARTGMPEEPSKILQMAQIEPLNIRASHNKI